MAHHRKELARLLAQNGTDYVGLTTDQPLDMALHAYLEQRLAHSRVR